MEEETKPTHNTLTPGADLVLDWSMGLWVYATAIDWRRVHSNPVIVGWVRHSSPGHVHPVSRLLEEGGVHRYFDRGVLGREGEGGRERERKRGKKVRREEGR